MTEITELSLSFLDNSQWFGWLVFALLTGLSVYQYRHSNPPLSGGIRTVMISLRALALLALFLTMFEPVISYQLSGERKPRLTIVTDVSGSMRLDSDGASRLNQVDDFLAGPIFAEIKTSYDITRLYLAESLLTSRSIDESTEALSGGTALGESLGELARRESVNPADKWLLFSDGINNSGRDPRQIAGELPTAVVTIGVGASVEGFDIELADLNYNPVAYIGSTSPITAHLEWRNAPPEAPEALVQVLQKDNLQKDSVVASERIRLGEGDLAAEIELVYTPVSAGGKFLRVVVSSVSQEKRTKNNSRSFSIKVLKNRVRVLLVTESLDWDYKFVKRALGANERIELIEVVGSGGGPTLKGSFPRTQAELNSFDIVVLHNPPGVRADNRFSMLTEFVRKRGGGVLTLVGDRFSKNQSGRLVSARQLDSLLPFRPTPGPARVSTRTTSISILTENMLHPALRIDEGSSSIREDWKEFAPFSYVAPLTEPAPGALALGESEYGALNGAGEERPISMLAVMISGSGKTLCLNGGPLWRMSFQSVETELAGARFESFLIGAVNWLSVSEDVSPVKIQPIREIFSRGEQILFSATAFDLAYRELEDVEGEVYLYGSDSRDTLVTFLEKVGAGRYRAKFDGVPPGSYRFEGRALSGGNLIQIDTGRIEVAEYSLEERETTPHFAVLQTISRESGGRYFHTSQLSELGEALTGEMIHLAEAVEIPLRGPWQFLLVFVVALAIEWVLRKRYQLL